MDINELFNEFINDKPSGMYKAYRLHDGFYRFLRGKDQVFYNSFIREVNMKKDRIGYLNSIIETSPYVRKVPCGCGKRNQKYNVRGTNAR